MTSSIRYGWVMALVGLTSCEDVIDLDPIDETPPVEAAVRPPPISGGTLTITSGNVAVAADPDRDLVHIVDLGVGAVRHTVVLEPGDEPGRVVEGSETLVHVILRGSGVLATIDPIDGTVIARREVCADPRGLAFDPDNPGLHVACADGTLMRVSESPGGVAVRQQLGPDLRDVVMVGGKPFVSRFRSAELFDPDGGQGFPGVVNGFESHAAWRTRPGLGGEQIVMLHQIADARPVPIEPEVDDLASSALPYGGGGGFCSGSIVSAAITVFDGADKTTIPVNGTGLAVDIALSPDGEIVALATPGADEHHSPVVLHPLFEGFECFPVGDFTVDAQVTAVAFAKGGKLVMQSREPPRLLVLDNPDPFELFGRHIDPAVIELEGDSRFDSAHELFHRTAEAGIACASCHPEGGDDGHVWNFEGLGKRRTQPLDVGLEGTAPFHWNGDMDDFGMLVTEVFNHRMGGTRQSEERTESFARWLFEQKLPPARAQVDESLAQTGEALFAAYGCATCHSGDHLSNNTTVAIRGDELQVPSLRRVSLRPPFMHDGRSATLTDSVWDMLAATNASSEASPEDVAAIVAFLSTR